MRLSNRILWAFALAAVPARLVILKRPDLISPFTLVNGILTLATALIVLGVLFEGVLRGIFWLLAKTTPWHAKLMMVVFYSLAIFVIYSAGIDIVYGNIPPFHESGATSEEMRAFFGATVIYSFLGSFVFGMECIRRHLKVTKKSPPPAPVQDEHGLHFLPRR